MMHATHAGLALWVLLSAVLVAGCNRPQQPQTATAPPNVNVSHPEVKSVRDFAEYTGRVAAVESVEVRAQVSGYLQKVAFTDGREVKQGQLLFQIDPRPFQVQLESGTGQLEAAKGQFDLGDAKVKRLEPLVKQQAASQYELDQAMAQRNLAQGQITTAQAIIDQAKLNLDYAAITSPIDGRISRPLVTEGNLISSNTLLTTIVSTAPIYVYFNVDEPTYQKQYEQLVQRGITLEQVVTANVPVYAIPGGESGQPIAGVLDFIDNQVDPQTGTITARAVYKNDPSVLVAGGYVRVKVPRGKEYSAVLVPDRAIGRDQDRRYVVVVDDKGIADFRQVQTGEVHDGMRSVTSGLKGDEWIVVDGLQRARPGKPVTPNRLAAGPPATAPAPSASPAPAPAPKPVASAR